MNIIETRLAGLNKSLIEKEINTLLVLAEENRRYLSGFTPEDLLFDESAGALFITEKKFILATDSRYKLQAKNEAPLYDIVCYKEGLAKEIPNILKELKTKRLGFESARISHMQYKKIAEELASNNVNIELVEADDIMENLRTIKDEAEINEIRKALFTAESAFSRFIETIEPEMSEKDAAWGLEKELRKSGADSLSFPVICASGKNSALPHAVPGEKKIKPGRPVLFDWGVKINGYCSDISRTIVIGKPDETFIKVFTTVQDAQNKAIEAIMPGISTKAVDKIAREYIEQSGFKDKFGHGLGHGIGLAVHEPPRVGPIKDVILKPQMVFTVEPGIYLPNWGGVRLENMVVVRDHGAEVLNRMETGWNRISC